MLMKLSTVQPTVASGFLSLTDKWTERWSTLTIGSRATTKHHQKHNIKNIKSKLFIFIQYQLVQSYLEPKIFYHAIEKFLI